MPEKLNMGYSERYKESEKMLSRSLDSIPCGTQTVAKGAHLYPYGASPFFVERALGSEVWDVDGNKYIDFISSLATVILGHCDADVVRAVKNQLDDGVGFSLPHPLEHQVAELIIDMVPCAEKVRFMKKRRRFHCCSGSVGAGLYWTRPCCNVWIPWLAGLVHRTFFAQSWHSRCYSCINAFI